jgi:hypothetical protein
MKKLFLTLLLLLFCANVEATLYYTSTYKMTDGDSVTATLFNTRWTHLDTRIDALEDTAVSDLLFDVSSEASGHLLLYDGTDSWNNKAMSGDATISNAGVVSVVDDSHNHVYSNIDPFTEANLYTILSDVTQFYEAGDEDTIAGLISAGAYADDSVQADDIDLTDFTLNDLTFDVGSVDKTEFGYLDGVTSAIQTQLSGKQGTLTNEAGLYSALSDVSDFVQGGEANSIDSDMYVDASIDHEHLAADVISGMTDVTAVSADYFLLWDATDGALKKCDADEVIGGGAGGATYRELTLLPQGAVLDDDNPAVIDLIESTGTATPRFYRAKFDDGDDDALYWSFVMPSDATASQDLILDIYWYSDEDVAEDVVWAVQVSATTADDADNVEEQAADTADTVTDSADASEAKALIKATLTIDYANCDGAVAGDLVTVKFYRDGDNGSDSHTNECYLLNAHLKIPRS